MLKIICGTDWVKNRDVILSMISADVAARQGNRILLVPELISHDTERRVCLTAGDTASRYAEVLSFTRLYRRVIDYTGCVAHACMDDGGRLIAMAAAARQLHSKLKAYAAVESRPEFLSGLVDAIDEFKRCCIASDDLLRASENTEGILAQKIEELSLLYEAYDAVCANGMRDPSDQMTWLLEELEASDFAQKHMFYIDGFPDFTRQHMAILEHIVCSCETVIISFNCDAPNSLHPAFEKAGETAGHLINFARRNNVPYQIEFVEQREDALKYLRNNIFQGELIHHKELDPVVFAQTFHSEYEECIAAAERVLQLIQTGARFKDIGIVCSDMNAYQNSLTMVFDRYHYPLYQSGTEEILDKTVIQTVLTAMEAALDGFEQRDVLRYLKSALSPIDPSDADTLENYVIMWNINGNRWQTDWIHHPNGLDAPWTDEAEVELSRLNTLRKNLVDPLVELNHSFHKAVNVSQQVMALYNFFESICLAERLSVLADFFDETGDYRNSQILDQLWQILLSALEQLNDVLGSTSWTGDSFTRLFRMLLSQYDVGTIPPAIDSVMFGPVSAMRCHEFKHLILLGAKEGVLPGYSGSKGILSDQERLAIRKLGIPLTGGDIDGVKAEFAEIYGVFAGAESTVSVFTSGALHSFIYKRVCALIANESNIDTSVGSAKTDMLDAAAFLSRTNAADVATYLDIADAYNVVSEKRDYRLGTLKSDTVKALYGHDLHLSASQVDKLADCRLSYFMHYGLRAKERKSITVDPAEFGTYVHDVLENTAREVMGLGGFHVVTLEKTLEISEKYSLEYIQNRFSQIDSHRVTYLYQRNTAELRLVVEELWKELNQSSFEPADFEVAFGSRSDLPTISIFGSKMNAFLRGFVDRVDTWNDGDRNYFRVVDYKTGRKDFDYCDIFNGYGLQMLLYLFALEDMGQQLIGDAPIPAGVQYFPARVPLISADSKLTSTEADAVRIKSMKRKGLLLSNERVLSAMEPDEHPMRLNYTRKKDGSISGDLADGKQFRLLKLYISTLLGKMVDDIASGDVTANPYTRGSSHNACTFCPFGAVCHPDSLDTRRNYKAITREQFWELIEREVMSHG